MRINRAVQLDNVYGWVDFQRSRVMLFGDEARDDLFGSLFKIESRNPELLRGSAAYQRMPNALQSNPLRRT
jgi:hypothetical protein